jgi:methionyl-tRNA formyltransferase
VKIVFFGTSAFAGRILAYLFGHNIPIVAVVTKPDKPKGRSSQLTPPPVKETTQQIKPSLPIHQPVKASTPEFAEILKSYNPDLFVVIAYGEIIKTNLLQIPKWGCINVHPSLLPKYRGANPIVRCLMNGDRETAVCIMDMVLEMDAGDILEVAKLDVPEAMNFGELDQKLSEIAGPALIKTIQALQNGTVKRLPQNPAHVTFAPKLAPGEDEIKWDKSAFELHNLVRALSPSPGAWCWLQVGSEKKRIKIKKSEVVPDVEGNPGKNHILTKQEWVVACGKGGLRLLEVQLEGKKSLPVAEFLRGSNTPLIFS